MPPTGVSRYNSVQRYYNPHSVGGTENQQPTVLKTAESVASLHPTSPYVAPPPPPPAVIPVPQPNNELLKFIEKQEGYIEQLERESQFCRVCVRHRQFKENQQLFYLKSLIYRVN